MLESDGRMLLVLLSLLAGTWGSSVSAASQTAACSTGSASTFEAGVSLGSAQGADSVTDLCGGGFAAAADFLEPPAAPVAMPSSAYPLSLPAVPKSMLMVVLGFLCVSLVHDRKLWLAVVASILSFSHGRPHTALSISSRQHGGRHLQRLVPCDVSLDGERQVPLGPWRHDTPTIMMNAGGRDNSDLPPGIVHAQSFVSDDFLPCVASITDGPGYSLSPLIVAQLARGPPLGPARILRQPSRRRVGARKTLFCED